MSLYKFTHIPLLKNNSQLKQKSDKQSKKQKKPSRLLKNKYHIQLNKEKEKKEEEGNALEIQKKKKK